MTVASSAAITLQRELIEAIDCKFTNIDHDDLQWPPLTPISITTLAEDRTPESPLARERREISTDEASDSDDELPLRTYWRAVKDKHAANGFIAGNISDLDTLPPDWSVVSINVTEDRNTMFVSRHQRGHEPLVFCLPLDRQGRREGEEDLFTFDAASEELAEIIRCSDEGARSAKHVEGREGKAAWWAERKQLDKRMEELLGNMEFCWLGAFKVSSPTGSIAELSLRFGTDDSESSNFARSCPAE